MNAYTVVTYRQRPDLIPVADDLTAESWPEFMLNDTVANRLFPRLEVDFPDFQFLLLDGGNAVIGVGNSIPVAWDGLSASLSDDGWDWVLEQGFSGLENGVVPNTLSALSISIPPSRRGQGLSRVMVEAMVKLAADHGFGNLIAPVRPNQMHRYPLTPVERYARWTNDDGAPFDAWMRVHWRLGAEIVKPCPRSMRIEGSVQQWQDWTGMRFPETGDYIVPGALAPVRIEREADRGIYVEPNVWMRHRIGD
ncbi:MAG: GNAT family N-acetyltransferase [Chloroflexota bacterium]